MPEIIVKIDKKTGDIKIEGMGFQGDACLMDIEKIRDLLEGKVVSEETKSEDAHLYYDTSL